MIGARLQEERNRLGMTQDAFAELAMTKKRTLASWEGGATFPNANHLAVLEENGVDTHYVISGTRSKNNVVAEKKSGYSITQKGITEQHLVDGLKSFLNEAVIYGNLVMPESADYSHTIDIGLVNIYREAAIDPKNSYRLTHPRPSDEADEPSESSETG